MFSFHKPKVYRSSSGCCICKAKSSSSRFTDSRKYESDFVECFQLQEPRSGEVCNACVLLVKRWKKLPEGSQRNWRHVVDARAGPGTKSATKFKSKQKRKMKSKATNQVATAAAEENIDEDSKKDVVMMEDMREQSPSALSDEINGGDSLSDLSVPPSPTPSEDPHQQSFTNSPTSTPTPTTSSNPHRTRSMLKRLAPPPLPAPISEFIDTDYWKREKVCCGIVFKGRHGQLLIDTRFFKPCHSKRKPQPQATSPVATSAVAPAVPQLACPTTPSSSPPFSDTSSDSGYDESSNQSEVTSLLSIAAAAAAAVAAAN